MSAVNNSNNNFIRYEFPAVRGELFLHAFCVLDAERITVRSTMPEDFSYRADAVSFHSNTRLFGDSETVPKGRTIRYRSQCRGGTYLRPSHEYYHDENYQEHLQQRKQLQQQQQQQENDGTPYFNDGIHNQLRASGNNNNKSSSADTKKKNNENNSSSKAFSYDGVTFALDIVPRLDMDTPDPAVTICAFVPDPSLWGQLTGGWDAALREEGFVQERFEDTGEMIWEVHCKEVTASEYPPTPTSTSEEEDRETTAATFDAASTDADGNGLRGAKKNLKKFKYPKYNWLGQSEIPLVANKPISTEDQRLRKLFLF